MPAASPRNPGPGPSLVFALAGAVPAVVLLALLAAVALPALMQPRAALNGPVCFVAVATPYDPAAGADRYAPRAIPAEARCPVCGMYPARAPSWAGQVIYSNGDAYFFDAPLNLLLYLQDPGRYSRGRSRDEIAVAYLRVMDDPAWRTVEEAAYVSGAAWRGPMGANRLLAFAHTRDARQFAERHGGRLLRLAEIDATELAAAGTAAAHH